MLQNRGSDIYSSVEVLYAGDAPGLVQGTRRVNFQLPGFSPGPVPMPFALQVGSVLSPLFGVYVKP